MANLSESDHQVLLFRWARKQGRTIPELQLLFHVPNGGERTKSMGARLTLEGVEPGVPDLCLPVARKGWHGLWIELKNDAGELSGVQRTWLARLGAEGHCAIMARGATDARHIIVDYLGLHDHPDLLPLPTARIAR